MANDIFQGKKDVCYKTNAYFCGNFSTMKKYFLIALTLFGLFVPSFAQGDKKVEDRIQLARDKYAEGVALIASNMKEETPHNYTTVVRQQNWPAIGEKVDKMEFYYNEIEDEDNPYPAGYALRMVRHTYNVTVREHLEEYLYDDDGKPLFFFMRYEEFFNDVKLDYVPKIEIRHYYDVEGNVIRSIYKMSDKNGKMQTITEKNNPEIFKEISWEIQSYPSDFTYLKKVFDTIYKNE